MFENILNSFKNNCSPHDKDLGCETSRIIKAFISILIIFLIIFLVNKYL